MSYKVATIAPFRKNAKKLSKKYPSIKIDLAELGRQLAIDPIAGISMGNNCDKIRMAIASKRKGKSGGARIITHFHVSDDTVVLLFIYEKSEQETLQVPSA